ncbi:hypothetical protein MMC14_001898 [Varicellaria rhodocarpa]|nr:hypothetical protein [Varicellaria rhodocarpa]
MPENHVDDPSLLAKSLTASITAFNGLSDVQMDSVPVEVKHHLARAANKLLLQQVGNPEDAIFRVAFGGNAQAALRAALEMGVFEIFEEEGRDEAGVDELAESVGAESVLVARIMRALSAVGFFRQTINGRYALNRVSRRFTNSSFRTLINGMSGVFSHYLPSLPEYLASISFCNPSNPQKSLFRYATGIDANFFEWLHDQPKQFAQFSAAMAVSSTRSDGLAQMTISHLLPAENAASYPSEADDPVQQVLLVDVGGGRGQIIDNVRKKRPELRGRMIVQDLPREIEGREPCEGVECMAHDFFTPQPIMGAYIYLLRHILHDWPDAACRSILTRIVPVMRRDHSRIIIIDAVLPGTDAHARLPSANVNADTSPSVFWSLLDIGMMTLGGMERTVAQWQALVESVEGLRVGRVEERGGRDGLVEALLR